MWTMNARSHAIVSKVRIRRGTVSRTNGKLTLASVSAAASTVSIPVTVNDTYLLQPLLSHFLLHVTEDSPQIGPEKDRDDDGQERECDDPEAMTSLQLQYTSASIAHVHNITMPVVDGPHVVEIHTEVSGEKCQGKEDDCRQGQPAHDFAHVVRGHVKCVVDQVLADAGKHVEAAEDVLHVVVDVGQVDLRLVAHIALDLDSRIEHFGQRCDTIYVVSTEAVDKRLDRLEGALVQDEVALQDVYCTSTFSTVRWTKEWNGHTPAHMLHAGLEQDRPLQLQDSALIFLYDFQGLVHD